MNVHCFFERERALCTLYTTYVPSYVSAFYIGFRAAAAAAYVAAAELKLEPQKALFFLLFNSGRMCIQRKAMLYI